MAGEGESNTIINEGTIDALTFAVANASDGGTGIRTGMNNTVENRTGGVIDANFVGVDAGAGSMVTNQAGATINAGTTGIVVGTPGETGGTIVNDGDINVSVAFGTGILINSGAVEATNNGTVDSAGNGFAVNTGADSMLVNNGTIDADGDGFIVFFDAGLTITNNSMVNVRDDGFDLYSNGAVTNSATGIVMATGGIFSDGVEFFGSDNTVDNAGQIVSTSGYGATFGSDFSTGNTINNAGLLQGGAGAWMGNDNVETLNNTGQVIGDLTLMGGDDVVTLGEGSDIDGNLDGGMGTDTVTSTGDGSFDGSIIGVEQLTVTDGTLDLNLTNGSDVTTTTVNGGQLNLTGTLTTTATTNNDAVLAGNGTIDGDFINFGTASPGASIGALSVTGNFMQGAAGTLAIEFGPTGENDLLDVTGSASLAGTLDFFLVDNGVAVGDVFTFLTADAGVTGTFDLVNNAGGSVGTFDVIYNAFDVQLTILSLEGCVQTGSNVLCIGTDPNGFTNIVDDGLDTVVEPDAIVNNPDGNGLTLGNNGTVDNPGTIDVAGNGIDIGDGNDITNTGLIIAVGDGIYAGDDNSADLDEDGFAGIFNAGEIDAGAVGIRARANNLISNTGTIAGDLGGVLLFGTGNLVENMDGGLITGATGVRSLVGGQTVINRTGARIEGGIELTGGGNEVGLESGSVLVGTLDLTGGEGDTLRLFGAGDDVVPVDIEGAELLVKEGDGTWTLNDELGVEHTQVQGGTLIVGGLVAVDDDDNAETPDVLLPVQDATLVSPLVDVTDAVLGGHGMVIGDVTVGGGGLLAPGASIGTLTILGNATFSPIGEGSPIVEDLGGAFEAELNDAGNHDRLDVQSDDAGDGGAAMLAGTLDVVLDAEFAVDDPDTADVDESVDADGNRIVQADFTQTAQVNDIIVAEGGVEGAFQQVSFQGGANDGSVIVRDDNPVTMDVDEEVRQQIFKGFLEYQTDRVRITSIPDLVLGADTVNQASVAAAIDSTVPYGLSTDPFVGLASQVGVSGNIPGALDALHPERYNAYHEVAINFSRGTLYQAELRSLEARNGTRSTSAITINLTENATVGASEDDNRATFWISANYDTVDVNAKNGFIGYGIDTLSGYVGFDYLITDSLLLGLMGGFGNADVDYDNRTGSGDVDSWQLAGYMTFFGPRWFVNLAGGYGELDIESSRDINLGAVNLSALSEYDGDATFFSAQAGYAFMLGNDGWQATPEIGLTYVKSKQDGFTETGASPANLIVNPFDAESLRLSGQIRFSKTMRTDSGGIVVPYVRIGMAHELEDDLRPITARFEGMATDFTVFGRPAAGTTATFGVGISGEVGSGITLFIDYAGEIGGSYSDHNFTGGARITF